MVFLCVRLRRVYERIQRGRSTIFTTFFILVFIAAFVCTLRCVVAMCLPASATANGDVSADGEIARGTLSTTVNKICWLFARFCLLFVESSFIVFALIGSALENNQRTVRRILVLTACVTGTYSVMQSILELGRFDDDAALPMHRGDLYQHGGMLFWFVSSALFTVIYGIVLILRCIPQQRLCFTLPSTFRAIS
jgi:transmembrane protein adipocyte-associated 1